MAKTIGLVGNQNSGKTTLFNALTGMNASVGNWPGVTIERKEGYLKGGKDYMLVDTPGIYSLSPYTDEEKVTRRFCLESKPDLIINIIDATALERSLYLSTQLFELNTDVVIALNMADILEKNGISIDIDKLQEELGVSIVRISAKTGEGVDNLITLIRDGKYRHNPHLKIYASDVQKEIDHIEGDLNTELEESRNPKFAAVKVFERDPFYKALSNSSTENEVKEIESKYQMDAEQIIADQRYDFVTKLKSDCVYEKEMPESITDKLDKVLLNKYLALPIFILVMVLVYFLSVGLVGSLTSDFIDAIFNGADSISILGHEISFSVKGLGPILGEAILSSGGSVWAADLVQNGLIVGIASVLNFLPQLIVLFYCMSLLEASGYMNRIAFFLDRIFKKFGLSGKSIIPFIVGTGCSVPGVMSARTVENEKERDLTIILTPFVPCSAKLPIIALLSSVIFPGYGWVISVSVYFVAIAIILITALIAKKLRHGEDETSFISELPSYKWPNQYYAWREVYDKSVSFIKRAGTVIFLCSLGVWVLTRFNWVWQYVGPSDINDLSTSFIGESMLASIGKVLAYLFIPAWGGNYSWGATVSALQGIIAKEQVVSSLSVISGKSIGEIVSSSSVFAFFGTNSWAAYSFIAFNLFSTPCFGALAAMKKELGSNKKFLQAILLEIGWSYILSTILGLIGWGTTGWKAVEFEASTSGNGVYLGAKGFDAWVLLIVIALVLLVVYLHWIRPHLQGRNASCASCEHGAATGKRLLHDYRKEKKHQEKK
ncbi:MAG: ferrous iron transport protein B [Bacilli bacterium]|nr:ferrous iron transport protein B [Bacilli bacterium]MCI2054538.1 ferrous iron transport protein B [Bacilli bacterium]